MDSSVFIPITFWSTSKPLFRISTVSLTPNFKRLITGSYNGQLCLWNINFKEKSIVPTNILIGHKDTVVCMTSTNDYVISSCEGQVMCRWNLDDGYCTKTNTSLFVHRKMELYSKSDGNEEFIFACGDYSEIFVINPFTLQVTYIFHSKTNNMWLSSFQIIISKNNRTLSSITTDGCVKLWRFDESISDLQCENQSWILPTKNIVDFKYNSTLTQVLIVSTNSWMVYDSEFSNCIYQVEHCNEGKLLGGNFCDDDVILWTNSGKFYLYKISDNEHELISVFLDSFSEITLFEPSLSLVNIGAEKYLIKGDAQGRIIFWKIDFLHKETFPEFYSALTDNFVTKENAFFNSFIQSSTITCCIFVLELDRFFLGCFDGSIRSIPATESLMSFYFPSVAKKQPQTQTFLGHKGKINCLLYPYEKYSYFNKSHLVSGGSDFSVCLWNIFQGELLFKFCVQSGEILTLILPPDGFSLPVKLSVCSISSDHSVALLNLKDYRCIILTSRHEYPVVTVHWKPLDDYMIVESFDGTIYVWQIETGYLERVLNGVMAQEVIYACSELESGIPDFNFYIHEDISRKNTMKQKVFNVLMSSNCSPFKLSRFLTNEISESHMFLCDLESALAQFSCDFKSEFFDCAINSNVYYLTKTLSNELQKKPLASEKIKHQSEIYYDKLDYPKNNNVKPSCEENKMTNENCEKHTCEIVLNLVRFFLSSIHLWGLDPRLDDVLSSKLGLLKPEKSICFGIISRPGVYSLFLPAAENSRKKSSTLFSSICIAMIALSKILLSFLKEELLTESNNSLWNELFSIYEMSSTQLIDQLGVSRPNIEVLAKTWQNKCFPLREIVQKLLGNYLQGLEAKETAALLSFWYKYLPHFKILDKTLPEKVDFENVEVKAVALVLFGAVGSDLKFKSSESSCQENYVYQTCASFVYLILLPISQKLRMNNLVMIAADFIGRGYIVWEHFLKIEKITPILFQMCSHLSNKNFDFSDRGVDWSKSLAAHNSLKSIAIARTAAFINFLKNEINQFRLSQNYHFLTDNPKPEILAVLVFLLEKTPYIMLSYMKDVISLIIHCIDFSHLRQENLSNLIPVMQRFPQVHHSVSSQRIAVGLATGSIVVHDLKTGKDHEIPAHNDSVSAVKFSEDGKYLVTYSCYEKRLIFWQVLTGIFGWGQIQVKCTKSYQTHPIHDEEIRNHLDIASLTWTDKKSVVLSLCDNTKHIFQS